MEEQLRKGNIRSSKLPQIFPIFNFRPYRHYGNKKSIHKDGFAMEVQ